MITMLRIAGLVFLLLAAGCAGVGRAPPSESAVTGTTLSEAGAARPPRAAVSKEGAVAAKPEARPAPPPAVEPAAPVAKAEAPPAASAPPKVPARAAPAEPARKKEATAPPAAKPAPPPTAKPPPLDLTVLEKRLKETNAIGVFTKLTLKNQVDELLDRFRAYYEGRVRTTLAQLRQPYDLLILKVLSLLQDNDPSLARAVAESREAIWGILSDPNKFRNL